MKTFLILSFLLLFSGCADLPTGESNFNVYLKRHEQCSKIGMVYSSYFSKCQSITASCTKECFKLKASGKHRPDENFISCFNYCTKNKEKLIKTNQL